MAMHQDRSSGLCRVDERSIGRLRRKFVRRGEFPHPVTVTGRRGPEAHNSADVAETCAGNCTFCKDAGGWHSQSAGLAGHTPYRVDHTVFGHCEVNERGSMVRYQVRRMLLACTGSTDGNPLRLKDVTAPGSADRCCRAWERRRSLSLDSSANCLQIDTGERKCSITSDPD